MNRLLPAFAAAAVDAGFFYSPGGGALVFYQ